MGSNLALIISPLNKNGALLHPHLHRLGVKMLYFESSAGFPTRLQLKNNKPPYHGLRFLPIQGKASQ